MILARGDGTSSHTDEQNILSVNDNTYKWTSRSSPSDDSLFMIKRNLPVCKREPDKAAGVVLGVDFYIIVAYYY